VKYHGYDVFAIVYMPVAYEVRNTEASKVKLGSSVPFSGGKLNPENYPINHYVATAEDRPALTAHSLTRLRTLIDTPPV
jgi:hypothetical protein